MKSQGGAMFGRTVSRILVLASLAAGLAAADTITISGQITAPGGAPVANVELWIIALGGEGGTAVTDGSGAYQMSVAPGAVAFHARPPLQTRLAEHHQWIGDFTADFTFDLELAAGALVSGRVNLPDGRPATGGMPVDFYALSPAFPDGTWLSAHTMPDSGTFEVVAPLAVYWLAVNPSERLYTNYTPLELSGGDVTDLVLTLSYEEVNPVPSTAPDAGKISFGAIDDIGEAEVRGAPGAAIGLAHVLVVNLDSLHQAHTVSAADGSFSTRVFAPPGSSILIKHGGTPMDRWDELEIGVSMKLSQFPGTIITLPHTNPDDGDRVGFNIVGPVSWQVDFLADTVNWVGAAYVGTGTMGPSRSLSPGATIDIEGTLRIYSPALDSTTNIGEITAFGNLAVMMLFDADGRAVEARPFMSSRLTPTGFPIQGSPAPGRELGADFAVDGFTRAGDHAVEAAFNLSAELPGDLPPGHYRPFLTMGFNGAPQTDQWLAAEVDSRPFEHQQAPLPPIEVVAGEIAPPRLVWRLLMEDPVLGTRGTGALEDRGTFEFAQQITSQGAPYIVPPVDLVSGRPITYRLEPFLPRMSWADRRIPSRPMIPLALPGGHLQVIVEPPGGGIEEISPAPFTQSQSRTRATRGGNEINPGTTQINDLYSLTTGEDRFHVTFDEYGHHFVIMAGTVNDIWGNEYTGGGAYEVWAAHPLDVDPGVLPGTPLAAGDAFNPTIRITPRVPADVELTVTLYPDSDPAQAVVQSIQGTANAHGVFTSDDPSIVLNRPGEYRVDLKATYVAPTGALHMAAVTWGGVVMTPATEAHLVAHGRRGIDSLPEIPPAWFVASRDLTFTPGEVSHFFNPYYNGDIIWTRMLDQEWGGDALIVLATVQDTVGTIEQAIETRLQRMGLETVPPGSASERFDVGELPIFTSTTSGQSPLIAPQDIDQIAYSYRSSQRPGVRIRELVGEEPQTGGYWRLDTLYDDQPSVGFLGDQPHDFKFQYVGVVFRDLTTGHSEYLGQGSGWVFIPDDDPLGSRSMPPFAGPGNGGWTTEGGPILTLDGEDIDIFIEPTGVRPGAVLEVGDTFVFAGHIMPTLPSTVAVTVTSPSGTEYTMEDQANRVGYYYQPGDDLTVDEPGLWTVDVRVWHDGQCSAGATVPPYPTGDVLGSDSGRYAFYVVAPGAPPLAVSAPRPGHLSIGNVVTPIVIKGWVPGDLDNATVDYTITMPGVILDHGQVAPRDGVFRLTYDPAALQQVFPNLDLVGRNGLRTGLSDTVAISLFLEAEREGDPVYRATTVCLQGQEVSIGELLPPLPQPPRRPSGRVSGAAEARGP